MKGGDEPLRKLRGLRSQAQSSAFRQAASFAMTPTVKSAKQKAPKGKKAHKTYKGRTVAPGFLERSITKKISVSKDGKTIRARVGMKREAFYGQFGFTTNSRKQKKNDFLTDALGDTEGAVLARFVDKLRAAIAKQAAK